jgi:phosphoglycerate dehydrogenase-like enzyme
MTWRAIMVNGLIVLRAEACQRIYGDEGVADIGRRVHLLAAPLTAEDVAERPDLLAEAEVIFSGWGAPVLDEVFLAAAPRLRAVFYGAGSIRKMMTEAAWDRRLTVTSAYAMNAIPVAEFTLAAILMSLKQVWHYVRQGQVERKYPRRRPMAGAYGTKVGLVSLGMIGRLVCERLRPFDLEVLAYDPYVTSEQAAGMDVKLVSLTELFQSCEVVSLHTPWLPETEGLITGELLGSMPTGATFLNTARGAVVREQELIEVMRGRPDLTAVLDVTHPEPPVTGSPLYELPNVVLTPHVAGSMDRECRRMGRLMIEEFDRWSQGEPLLWGLEREQAARMA